MTTEIVLLPEAVHKHEIAGRKERILGTFCYLCPILKLIWFYSLPENDLGLNKPLIWSRKDFLCAYVTLRKQHKYRKEIWINVHHRPAAELVSGLP